MPQRIAEETVGTLLSLADMLPGALYRCRNDRDWTMDFVSAGARELTGYTVDELVVRRTVTFGADLIVPDDRARAWDDLQTCLAARSPWASEYRIRRRDGQIRCVWEQGRGVFAADGSLEFLVGFIIDIEDRKRAEAAIAEREAELRRKNAEVDALSTPVLEIADGTLVVPLIGELGEARGARLRDVVLPQLVAHAARWLLLDITGLSDVSTASATALLRVARATRLLGARCILTGVQPQVARALVSLDLSLDDLQTAASLKDGLALRAR